MVNDNYLNFTWNNFSFIMFSKEGIGIRKSYAYIVLITSNMI